MDSSLHNTGGLKDFYVLRESGECVFHKSYTSEADKIEADGTLMSSFLSAINAFAQNVDTGTKMLETDNFRFVYHKNAEYIYVARTEKGTNAELIESKLDAISHQMESRIPAKFDGNVTIFQGVSSLIKEQFLMNGPKKFYEITGKGFQGLDSLEEKVYAFLRFKGRSQLSAIVKLMKIPEHKALKVTEQLMDKELVSSCS